MQPVSSGNGAAASRQPAMATERTKTAAIAVALRKVEHEAPFAALPRVGGVAEAVAAKAHTRVQAVRVFENISALLEAAGTSWQYAVKVTVFLADFSNFAALNDVYRQYVKEPYPARSTIQAPVGNSAISVDCIAVLPDE